MPATYNFTLNRDEVIKGALRILGVISQGQTPDASQTSDGAEALNILVKAWEADGMPVWAIKTHTFSLTASDGVYAIGSGQQVDLDKPERIYQVMRNDITSNVSIPLTNLTQQEYYNLSNRSQEGAPTQYYWDDKTNASGSTYTNYGNLYLYLVPDTSAAANNTITFVYQAPFADFDSSTDVPDFPQYWLRALKYGLADEVALEYGYPIKDRQELMMRAEKYKLDALNFTQEEGSYFFKIDNYRR
jgi:hypothetical protein